jgi:hypothetical protein
MAWARVIALGAMMAIAQPGPAIAQQAAMHWQDITPRVSLAGWTQQGGKAQFVVEGSELVGRSVADTPNSFLMSDATYGDFILEFEVKLSDPRLNSGMMVRGLRDPAYRQGVVHGYQVEVDPTARAWSGGIYDEQRRGWLYTLADNPAARAAFRPGDWNRIRVEAIGPSIRTFVNGVAAADMMDDMTARGALGLQVHSIGNPALAGAETRFRSIRILTGDATALATQAHALPADLRQEVHVPNLLTETQARQGWRLLWDGRTTDGWRGARLDRFPAKGWEIRDGVLSVLSSGGGEARNGGDIVTTRDFGAFELELEFRITPGANSGIKYYVDDRLLRAEGSSIGLEFQILDDARHPDAKMGKDGNRTVGSLYDLITATNLSEPDRAKRVNPPGQWNRARIVSDGRRVEHWLNGVKVVTFERGSPEFRALVANSKYRDLPGFGEVERGPILLQDHGDLVSFRSIRIRDGAGR